MFTIKIKTDNAAFAPAHDELARILRELAAKMDGLDDCGKIYDINGNHVGGWSLK